MSRAIIHQTFTLAPSRGSYSVKARTARDASREAAERRASGEESMGVAVYCAARDVFEVHALELVGGEWVVVETREMTEHERENGVSRKK